MGKVIILEGPDGGGKTTLANQLVKEFGYVRKHEGPPPPGADLVARYQELLNDSIESKQDVVHDRLWLGERIYGPISRGVDRLGDEGQRLFDRIHTSKKILQFVCLPPIETNQSVYSLKVQEKDDYLKSMDKWKEVYSSYNNWLYNNMGPFYQLFDYSNGDTAKLAASLADYYYLGRFPKGMVGSSKARYLFIGDQPNHESIDIPFHALNGSSGYLNRAIAMAGIKESELALANAYGPRGREFHALGSILNAVPNVEKIFLLGNESVKWYGSDLNAGIKIPCRVYNLPHPSYLKRFKGNNPQILANAIRKVIDGSSD